MRQIPQKSEIGSNDYDIVVSAIQKALIVSDNRVTGVLRDDKKKLVVPSPENCRLIQDLLAEAYWILEG